MEDIGLINGVGVGADEWWVSGKYNFLMVLFGVPLIIRR